MHNHHDEHINKTDYNMAFFIGISLNLLFVGIETIFGFIANSMSLLADAGHNMSDVIGLLLAWSAFYLSRKKATAMRTYGLKKTTILAALFNAILLLIAAGGIAWESINRFFNPAEVSGNKVIMISAIGIVINTVTALLFLRGRKNDLNIQGAFLHMLADAAVSFGVLLSGIAIIFTNWLWIDPILSVIIAVIILLGTWNLLKDSLNLSLDAVPRGINLKQVALYLEGLPGIVSIHDLHIWAISTSETALTVHLVKPNTLDDDYFIKIAKHELHHRFSIEHVTLQLDRGSHICTDC